MQTVLRGIVVKIAAIEQRTKLLIPDKIIGNVGLEIGADLSASVNLDDHMVFDNDENRAVNFYKNLVLKHVQAALEAEISELRSEKQELERHATESEISINEDELKSIEDKIKELTPPKTVEELISKGFTQSNVFIEVVRACEGVPRDAINILSLAGQRANATTISMTDIRTSAQQWYQTSKDGPVSANKEAKNLLSWIIDKVIKGRQAKAFLMQNDIKSELIDYLYDERVLHVLRKGMSAQDSPGIRYNVYGIDYGCYVDLINTAQAPKGLLDEGLSSAEYTEVVPRTDLRSVRRCILDLEEFFNSRKLVVL